VRDSRLRKRNRSIVAARRTPVDDRPSRISEAKQLRDLVVRLSGGIVARAPEELVLARLRDAVETRVPPGYDEHDGGERHLAPLEHQRLDMAGKMVHRDERNVPGPGQRLGE
jgi:hypothetical protein